MPELVTFKGRPVKRRSRHNNRLKLLFFSPIAGQDGDTQYVNQAEWDTYGKVEYFSKDQMPDVRKLAQASA